jgi:hypothetical protein
MPSTKTDPGRRRRRAVSVRRENFARIAARLKWHLLSEPENLDLRTVTRRIARIGIGHDSTAPQKKRRQGTIEQTATRLTALP